MTNRSVTIALIAVVALGLAVWFTASSRDEDTDGIDLSMIVVPGLTAAARDGRDLFDANCAACHGENATGSDKGPPLIHRIYEPSHHGDFVPPGSQTGCARAPLALR